MNKYKLILRVINNRMIEIKLVVLVSILWKNLEKDLVKGKRNLRISNTIKNI
jgi:hypothetical protein